MHFWRWGMSGRAFGRWWIIRRHRTVPPLFSERYVREVISFVVLGWRITVRPGPDVKTTHLDRPRYT